MIGYSVIKNLFYNLFATGIVKKIYHDVTILEEDNGFKYPVYREGEEFVYVGIDDTKIMSCYLRQTGPVQNTKTEFISANQKLYKIRVPYRLVLFNDFEKRNFDQLQIALMKIMYSENIFLDKIITNSDDLLNIETSPKNFHLGGTSFYCAFDFFVISSIAEERCPTEISCSDLQNPICAPEGLNILVDYSDGALIDENYNPLLVQFEEAKKINQLPLQDVLANDDLFLIGDPVTGKLYKTTGEDVKNFIGVIDNTLTFFAGESLSTGIAVIVEDNFVYKYDISNILHLGRVIGITKTSGVLNDSIKVQTTGIVSDMAYSFDIMKPCFVGVAATITTTVPSGAIMQPIGTAVTANSFFINLQIPIQKH